MGELKSNGEVERAIQAVQEQVRTMRSALEERIGERIDGNCNALVWMISYGALILNIAPG